MDKLVIDGGKKLTGEITISGAKNSCLPLMAATLLTDERCVIKNAPRLKDIDTMAKILRAFGAKVEISGTNIIVDPRGYDKYIAPYELVSTMRASICVLGPLLAKKKRAEVSFPGGCIIGPRPIDLHLKGLKALGAKIHIERGYIIADGRDLRGASVYLGGHFGSTVLGTDNVMMAAALAKGTTIIENAACEPEVVDLANFLKKMGAKIKGEGSHRIEIEGVDKLSGCEHEVIPDRIEAGTYIIAGAITGGRLILKNVNMEHLTAVIDKLSEAGVRIEQVGEKAIEVSRYKDLTPIDVTTLSYPGFPTDMQAQILALMCITEGISVITEKIYPERFIHISELARMGAEVVLERPSAIVKGVEYLSGAPVMASDLRASAGLVLAGLAARGKTEVTRVYHLDRGYEKLEEKLTKVGASVWREKGKG